LSEVTQAFEAPVVRKNRTAAIAVAVGALTVLLVGLALVFVYTTLSSRLSETADELDAAKLSLAQTRAELEETGSTDIASLQERLNTATSEIKTVATDVDSLRTRVSKSEKTLTLHQNCFPEVQAQVNGVSVNTSDQNGWLTGAYITNNVQVSRVCQRLLYPSPQAG
jgi:septal ring factor EnvC (AmiA/AmiB activator)